MMNRFVHNLKRHSSLASVSSRMNGLYTVATVSSVLHRTIKNSENRTSCFIKYSRQLSATSSVVALGCRTCWKCSSSLLSNEVICANESCGAVQPVAAKDDVNFFNLFGIKPTFEVDDKGLEGAYKNLQKQLHPDKFAKAGRDEREISTQTSAFVNHAYTILRSPLHRAEYMLWLIHGQKVYESENARLDPSLMAEMFEWREKVDDAKAHKDHRKSYIDEVAEQLRICEKEVGEVITDLSATEKASRWITRMKYFSKMAQELQESEEL